MPIHLHIVCGSFCATMAELSDCDRGRLLAKPKITTNLYKTGFLTPALANPHILSSAVFGNENPSLIYILLLSKLSGVDQG